MKIGNVDEIIIQVENLSGKILKAKEDFRIIVETAISKSKLDELGELAFHAKYIHGLNSIIKKREAVIDDGYFTKVGDEYKLAYKKLIELIQLILDGSAEFLVSVFKEKYFQLSHQSLHNINILCEDFSFLKLYLNDLKQKKDSTKN